MRGEPASVRPIILLGAARSGTKFLRDILGESHEIARVPYDTAYVWRYGNETYPHDAFTRDQATDRVKDFAPVVLRRLAGMGADDSRRLLEKTVGNTLRVGFVDEIFPNAQFIHLVRDGRAVTESAMRMWQAPPDWPALINKLRGMPLANAGYVFWFGKNLVTGLVSGRGGGKVWGPRYPGIEDDAARLPLADVCARQWTESVAYARRQFHDLPPERQHTVRFEDLLTSESALDRLLGFLNVSDPERVRAAFRAKAARDNLDKWRKTLSREQIDHITAIGHAELDAFGYLEPQAIRIVG